MLLNALKFKDKNVILQTVKLSVPRISHFKKIKNKSTNNLQYSTPQQKHRPFFDVGKTMGHKHTVKVMFKGTI